MVPPKLNTMTYKSLVKNLLCLFTIICAGMLFVGCSDNDEPNDENVTDQVIGAWCEEEDGLLFLVFDKNGNVFGCEESTKYPGKYVDSYEGSWYANGSQVVIICDGETSTAKFKNNKLIAEDEDGEITTWIRCSKSDVPSEAAPSGGSSSTTDALSGTHWKLTKITGWANDPDWYGERLYFQNNGRVTEYFTEGGSQTGTYSISGTTLKLDKIAFVNNFGPKYTFTKTSSKLTLVADKGTNMETTFTFDKY